MSTNEDKPFEPGEVIIWMEMAYVVVENYGTSGVVKHLNPRTTAHPSETEEIGHFRWDYCGEIAKRKEQ